MLPIAFSPCPNDTFLFHAWVHGYVGKNLRTQVAFGDIEQLNQWALEEKYPLMKVSLALLHKLTDAYQLLPVGAALGKGCGPKLIAKEPFPLEEITQKRVAIPGEETTAHRLFSLFVKEPQEKIFCLYHEIGDLLTSGVADAGLIIHESRFTYQAQGFTELLDLGALWEKRFRLPLPLGGLIAHRSLPPSQVKEITTCLQQSLNYAWKHPEKSAAFVHTYSQEKDPEVIKQHIDLYVNQETLSLSPTGFRAIHKLLEKT